MSVLDSTDGNVLYVDLTTGEEPPKSAIVRDDTIHLKAFGVAIVTLPELR